MAGVFQDLTPIECSVCKDTLDDPRALPCGHSYCGPPKNCLRGVQKANGVKCAVCKKEFNLQVSQLNPLYGIRDFIQQTTTSAKKVRSVKKGGCSQVMCKHHVNSPIMFWCNKCEEKSCTECFEGKHQSHDLISFTQYLKQKVEPLYKRIFHRVGLLEDEANCLAKKLQEINADNYQKQLLNSCSEELSNFTDEWKSVTEFKANAKAEVDLKVIESFISHSFEELDTIETRLKEIKISNLADFKFSTQITFFMPTERESPLKIGSIEVPYKDELDITFTIEFHQTPAPSILVKSFVTEKSARRGAGIKSMLGNIEIGLPFLDYKTKIMTENKNFSSQLKNEHHFGGLPAFTLGKSLLISFGCDFVFVEKTVQNFQASSYSRSRLYRERLANTDSSSTSSREGVANPESYLNLSGRRLANPDRSSYLFGERLANTDSSPISLKEAVAKVASYLNGRKEQCTSQ